MKKTPEQQEKDKLASKLRKAESRMGQTAKDLELAKAATNAHTKAGKSAIKKRRDADAEAMHTQIGALKGFLKDTLPSADPPTSKTTRKGGYL